MLLDAQPGSTQAAGSASQRKRPRPGPTVIADDVSSDEEGRAVGAPTPGAAADEPAEPHDEEPPGPARKKLRRSEPAGPGYRIGRKKPSPTAAAAAGAFGSTSVVIDLEAASQVQCMCSACAVHVQCMGLCI